MKRWPVMFVVVIVAAVFGTAIIAQRGAGRGGGRGGPEGNNDPFTTPIPTANPIAVNYAEFASIPDFNGEAARMMVIQPEPGATNIFINDMNGPLYRVSDTGVATEYLDVRRFVAVDAGSRERGVQGFTLHPQFRQAGTPGFGKLYVLTDAGSGPTPTFTAAGADEGPHDTVLVEFTASTPGAATYDGGAPRELIRWAQPFANHNGGGLSFNPIATPASDDFGLLYVGGADGGSGGDPLNLAQNRSSAFGKILRIDPLGSTSANGQYGIPPSNPFVDEPGMLGEIYAYGLRNPQRFAWDPATGRMFVADIGQNVVEEISPVTAGANLGWNVWEGSIRYVGRAGGPGIPEAPRGDPSVTYPVAEFDHTDPILQGRSAATVGVVYRGGGIPQISGMLLFGDIVSGEIFAVSADALPEGGQEAMRRVLFNDGGQQKTLLALIQAKNATQGREPASRADLRFGAGPNGRIFILNKADGTVRVLVP